MNGKERMLAALDGRPTPILPVTPHWWGVYKFQLAGVIHTPEDESLGWALRGEELARVDSLFYETFLPDMLHLSTGAARPLPETAERQRRRQEMRPAVRLLKNKRLIDEYVAAVTPSEDEIRAAGIYEHVAILAQKYGDEALILVNEGNPVCEVFENGGPAGDFQDALIATIEQPENMAYLLWKLYEAALGRMRVLKSLGAHGYIGSETCVSPDILSPATFRAIVFPALKLFYEAIGQMGLIPVTYFLGDLLPIIDDIAACGARALMIEEPKKGFRLEVGEVYTALDGRMALFGNLDSVYHLLWGNAVTVRQETLRQVARVNGDRKDSPPAGFIMACGSPLCLNTPPENIRAMLETARGSG
jgi:uroporphyrinogen-III decarboxylase